MPTRRSAGPGHGLNGGASHALRWCHVRAADVSQRRVSACRRRRSTWRAECHQNIARAPEGRVVWHRRLALAVVAAARGPREGAVEAAAAAAAAVDGVHSSSRALHAGRAAGRARLRGCGSVRDAAADGAAAARPWRRQAPTDGHRECEDARCSPRETMQHARYHCEH